MKAKKILSVLLAVCIIFGVCSIDVSANSYVTKPSNNVSYLIKHVGSGKYLDVTDVSTQNGARLQIWQRFSKHQNQVFKFIKDGKYWKIIANHSGKAIEVRNNSKSDYAEVAQWDYVGSNSQQWSIISNSDGTVSFKNRNSGKYLDVQGNGKANGTKLIQYYSNKTTAQKFKLYKLEKKDILNAAWTRKLSNSDISWTKINWASPVTNFTHFSKSGYYPTPGKRYLKRVEYIDADTVHNLIAQASLKKSTLKQIEEVISGEFTESTISEVLSKVFNGDVPGIGIALGVLETLATSASDEDWNNFVKATRSGKGIKKITYVTIEYRYFVAPLNNATVSIGKNFYVDEAYSYTYSVWDGSYESISAPNGYSGSWNYAFK